MMRIEVKKAYRSKASEFKLDVSLSIEKGSFVAIQGKSGAGKSTLLRLIAGLETPDEGFISVNDQNWVDSQRKHNEPIQRRNVGFVFQDYALFPHLSVIDNLKFGAGKTKPKAHIEELIRVMDIEDILYRKPDTLSGGQKQRVALARALVRKPSLLLLDEPLSALDAEIRIKLQDHIKKLHQQFNLTTLMITHDQAEVLRMADRLIQIEEGKLKEDGKPKEILGAKSLSGKFSFNGEVLSIEDQEFIAIVTVLVGQDTVRVVLDQDERKNLEVGDKVIVASKAFNPIIYRL